MRILIAIIGASIKCGTNDASENTPDRIDNMSSGIEFDKCGLEL
jgi:hypothetical protein